MNYPRYSKGYYLESQRNYFLNKFPDTGFYNIREPWIQKLITELVDPRDIFQREGYSTQDVLTYLQMLYDSKHSQYFGSEQAGIFFRTYQPNEYVIEPHIVGNGRYYVPLMAVGIDFLFTSTKVRKINNYTHLVSSKNIALRCGFTLEGTLSQSFNHKGSLVDVYVLGLKKSDYELRSLHDAPRASLSEGRLQTQDP